MGSGSIRIRVFALVTVVGLMTPLVTARMLKPDPAGLGTHQQLGLPPCSMRLILGIRCPACGMTTSWSHFTRGHFPASLRANPGGAGLAVIAVWAIGISLRSMWTGRWPPPHAQKRFSVALVVVGAVTITDWLVRFLD